MVTISEKKETDPESTGTVIVWTSQSTIPMSLPVQSDVPTAQISASYVVLRNEASVCVEANASHGIKGKQWPQQSDQTNQELRTY